MTLYLYASFTPACRIRNARVLYTRWPRTAIELPISYMIEAEYCIISLSYFTLPKFRILSFIAREYYFL